jgi:hypothetical protein
LFASPRVTGLPCPALPCRAVASDGPPVTPADCAQCCPPRLLRSRREVSPLLRVACAHVACCALPVLAFSLCAFPGALRYILAHPKATMATDRPAPTLCARRLRDADESDPHFRPRRLCSHLRRARSDQDDQPAAGHAGARWPLHPLLSVLYFRPLCTKNCAPDKGNTTPVVYTRISRCSVCIAPETRVPKPCLPYPGIGLNRLGAGVRIRVRIRVGVRVS